MAERLSDAETFADAIFAAQRQLPVDERHPFGAGAEFGAAWQAEHDARELQEARAAMWRVRDADNNDEFDAAVEALDTLLPEKPA